MTTVDEVLKSKQDVAHLWRRVNAGIQNLLLGHGTDLLSALYAEIKRQGESFSSWQPSSRATARGLFPTSGLHTVRRNMTGSPAGDAGARARTETKIVPANDRKKFCSLGASPFPSLRRIATAPSAILNSIQLGTEQHSGNRPFSSLFTFRGDNSHMKRLRVQAPSFSGGSLLFSAFLSFLLLFSVTVRISTNMEHLT